MDMDVYLKKKTVLGVSIYEKIFLLNMHNFVILFYHLSRSVKLYALSCQRTFISKFIIHTSIVDFTNTCKCQNTCKMKIYYTMHMYVTCKVFLQKIIHTILHTRIIYSCCFTENSTYTYLMFATLIFNVTICLFCGNCSNFYAPLYFILYTIYFICSAQSFRFALLLDILNLYIMSVSP
ncbi:hypothetical protein KUTeg_019722, partial [Tegillarca granosa]